MSCTMIAFEFDPCSKTLACSHMHSELQVLSLLQQLCRFVPGEPYVLGMHGFFVRVLYQNSTIYSCTIALTSLARWVSKASLSSSVRLAEVDDLLGGQGPTSLARWASLVVFLGHDQQKSTVYFGTRALTSLAGLASLSSCLPELD